MIGKQSKNFALLAFLLASSIISGCNDDGTSVREFGTAALSQGNNSIGSEEENPPTVTFDNSSIATGEFLAGDFAFSTGDASYMWIEAELFSGPAVEVYLLDEAGAETWQTAINSGGDLSGFNFASPYPDLEGTLSGTINTNKTIVTSGYYKIIVENTDAGVIQPEASADAAVIDMRLYIESMTADGTASNVRVISLSKVRVSSHRK